ncbi:MAG: tetratricopeptide repeat protein [Caulobacteraceae bacterium]
MSIQGGIGLLQQGRLAEAGRVFEAAVSAEPSNALAHQLLGIVQLQTGAPEAGLASLHRSIALNPRDAVAHGNLANALRDMGRADEALESYGRALELNPDFVDALCNRAIMLGERGRPEEALPDCERAVRLAPGHLGANVIRGTVLLGLGRAAEAAASFESALRLAPGMAELWSRHGEAMMGTGQAQAALDSLERALSLRAEGAGLRVNLGWAAWTLGRAEEALAHYDRAIALDPGLAAAWAGRGATLRLLDRHDEALEALSHAMALEPGEAQHVFNRGVVLTDLGRNEDACADLDAALALAPDFRPAKLSGAHAYLALGRFERGWELFEARFQGLDEYWFKGLPRWDGKAPLEGKTIVLRGEQGLGDTLQFCRYARPVKALGARVVLEVPAPLVRLLKSVDGVDAVVEQTPSPPPADYQGLLMSLPFLLGARVDTIPGETPYLAADPAEAARWEARLGKRTRPRVGLVWSGGFRDEAALRWINARRNIPLDRLAPLAGADVDFVSLQKGEPGEGELRALKAQGWPGPDMLEVMDEVTDFADTAALVQALDLVISVDTSTAHLAGALGKPVWIMNRYDSCWRWLAGRDDSPWYPSMRLFRQERMGQWDAVVARVRAELDRFSGASKS